MLVEPSPKVQDQDVGLPVEVSMKATVSPIVGALGEKLKPATEATAFTVKVFLVVLEPCALPTVSVTVNLPGAE